MKHYSTVNTATGWATRHAGQSTPLIYQLYAHT